jgi:hypothetical protein
LLDELNNKSGSERNKAKGNHPCKNLVSNYNRTTTTLPRWRISFGQKMANQPVTELNSGFRPKGLFSHHAHQNDKVRPCPQAVSSVAGLATQPSKRQEFQQARLLPGRQ